MKKNLKYLIELIVIVVGITLSFMVDEWREDNQKREDERELLNEFFSSLNADLNDLEFRKKWFMGQLAYIDTLHTMLESETENPRIAKIIAKVFHTTMFFPHTGPYEDLKQRGLSLLKDDAIKSSIVTHYEGTINMLDLQGDYHIKYFFNELVTFSFKNFNKFGAFKGNDTFSKFDTDEMIPIDYNDLRNNEEFYSIISTYRNLLSAQVTGCNMIMESSQICSELIKNYLNKDE